MLGTILVLKKISPRLPGALFAVVGAIIVSAAADLSSHGVSTLGDGAPRAAEPRLPERAQLG